MSEQQPIEVRSAERADAQSPFLLGSLFVPESVNTKVHFGRDDHVVVVWSGSGTGYIAVHFASLAAFRAQRDLMTEFIDQAAKAVETDGGEAEA